MLKNSLTSDQSALKTNIVTRPLTCVDTSLVLLSSKVKSVKNEHLVLPRDMLIWQIEKYLYPTSILGMIYHIRADAFIFFGL